MEGPQHTSNILLQTPQREAIHDDTGPPPLEDAQGEEAPYYEVTRDQLRVLCPIAHNLIRDLQITPVMSCLTHTRTPAANLTHNGALVNSLPQLINLMVEDLKMEVENNEPITGPQGAEEEGPDMNRPHTSPQPDGTQNDNTQVHIPPGGAREIEAKGIEVREIEVVAKVTILPTTIKTKIESPSTIGETLEIWQTAAGAKMGIPTMKEKHL